MNGDTLKTPATPKTEDLIPNTDPKPQSGSVKSKNPDYSVNIDNVGPTKRTSVDRIDDYDDDPVFEDEMKSKKPLGYASKKAAAQGMIDIALLTSNANQLRNLIEYQRETVTYYFVMFLIVLSLILQITVGVTLIFKGRYNRNSNSKDAASRVCTWIMAGTFLITIINLFIPIFSIPQSSLPNSNQTTL